MDDRDAYATLLAPLTPAQFEEEHWERRSLLVQRDHPPDLYRGLLDSCDLPALFALLEQAGDEPQVFRDGARREPRQPLIDFLHGNSLVINRIDMRWPPIGRLCASLRRHLHHVFAVMYLTPRAAQAVRVHSDDQDVFILQLAGSKEWCVYDAPQPLPYTDEQLGKRLPYDRERLGPPSLTAVLRPGSLLYVPRGVLHEARTSNDGGSLHITLTVQTSDLTWSGFVLDAILAVHRQHMQFRHALPLKLAAELTSGRGDSEADHVDGVPSGDGGQNDESEARAELRRQWGSLVTLTAEQSGNQFEASFTALRAKLQRHNDAQDEAVRRATMALEALPTRAIPPRLRLVDGVKVEMSAGPDGSWRFSHGDKWMRLSLPPHLTQAMTLISCTGREASDWEALPGADEIERVALVGCLHQLGILQPVPG